MRCEEAIRRLNETQGRPDPELVRHLQSCAECARVAQAERTLQSALTSARDSHSFASLAAMRGRVEAVDRETDHTGSSFLEKIMSQISNTYRRRPALAASLSLGLAAFLFVLLVPFSYTQVVGYEVTVAGHAPQQTISKELLTATIAALGYENVTVEETATADGCLGYIMAPIPSESEARDIAAALAEIRELDCRSEVTPVFEQVSGSLCAQAAEKLLPEKPRPTRLRFEDGKLVVDGHQVHDVISSVEMSDDQIRLELNDLFGLDSYPGGTAPIRVEVETAENRATRMIRLTGQGEPSEAALERTMAEMGIRKGDTYLRLTDGRDTLNADSTFELILPGVDSLLNVGGLTIQIVLDLEQ